MFRMVKAFLYKFYWEYRYYLLNYIFGVLGNLVLFLGLFYLIFGGGARPEDFYRGVTGFVLWMLGSELLYQGGYMVWEDSVLGTLEHVYMSPRPFWQVMLARGIAGVIVEAGLQVIFAVGAVLGGLALGSGLAVPPARWEWVGVAVAGSLVAFWGAGVAFVGLALLVKRVGSVLNVYYWLLLFMSGALVEISNKPLWFKVLAYSSPIGPAGQMIVESFSGGEPWKTLPMLAVNSAAYAVLGVLAMNRFLKEAMKRGKMARY